MNRDKKEPADFGRLFLCPEVLFSCGICAIINERQREVKAEQSAKGGLLCT